MKTGKLLQLPTFSRCHCFGIILCSALLVSACGESTTAVAPDLGAAQELAGPDRETPTVDPETPTVDPEAPTVDPETPTVDPEAPIVDPEAPEQDEPLALSGSVNSYPSSTAVESIANNEAEQIFNDTPVFNDGLTEPTSLSRTDMQPVQALVSLFLLSDVNFQTPLATVKSDIAGNYNVTASDVRDYLLQQQLIDDSATDAEVLASFRLLGRLQVRALIVTERNGVKRAMAIQSLADPADVDESGAPVPVSIDPIVHRVVKVIVDSIRDSVANLESMGLSPAVVDQLINTVVEEVVAQIDQILEETSNEVIEIPEGLTLDDVIDSQEDELELNVDQEQLDQLAVVLDGTETTPEDDQLLALENTVSSANEVADREESTLGSSLNSESQGLLSGFESTLNDQVNGSVEQRINEARQAGTDEALSEVFGESTDGVALEQALAEIETQKDKQSRLSIQRFFLSLGLGVLVDENEAGDAGVVALRLPLPYHLEADSLPGVAGLGERQIRLFKVGSGELDADSEYTSNPFVQLGVADENGAPMPPFKYVPALSDITAQVLPGLSAGEAQLAVDEANERVFTSALPTPEDYRLLDRVEILHELRERLHDTTLVSSRVIDVLVADRDRKIPLKRIAATIAREFQWIQQDIKLTPDGFPIHSGRSRPLAGGANAVDSSELVRALSITLGASPVSTVNTLTESNSFLAQFAPGAVEFALQSFAFDEQTDLIDALLAIYPEQPDGYLDLILGSISGEAEPEYVRERDRVARGLTTAIPASMYGQTLTSESEVNIRSALFFLDFALRREYLIDSNQGFYTEFDITRADGVAETRYVPDYDNIKKLEPAGDVSVAAMMSELLNITTIDDGELFQAATMELLESLNDIPSLPEYLEYDVDAYIDDLGPRIDTVDATCAVQMFDGSDPDDGEEHQRLNLAVYKVDYNENTGEPFKGERVDTVIASDLVQNDKGSYRNYRISGLTTSNGDSYGQDYVLRFEIDSYQNELPELYLYADGFVPEINLCDIESPLFVGPDQAFFQLPGLGLVSGQGRFHENPVTDPDFIDTDGNNNEPEELDRHFEWVDLSNFEVPGAPLYLTEREESEGLGISDFRFEYEAGQFKLVGPADSDVGFARLYGSYVDGKLEMSLIDTDLLPPLYGLQSVVGANARDIISSITSGETDMASSLSVTTGNTTAADSNDDSLVTEDDINRFTDTPSILDDDMENTPSNNGFEPESLYLFRDREDRFWVIELRYLDSFIDFDNSQRAFIDIGVATINNIGLIDVPNVSYDNPYPDAIDDFGVGNLEYYSLFYGDWLVLEKPSDYTGSSILPPEEFAFTSSEDYEHLRKAIDGITIRYAGDHFDENITGLDDVENVFGSPPDFSSVPVRLDAGREGITFVKLAFDTTEKRYVMDPLPQDATRYVAQLSHNDLIAIFDDQSTDDGPIYLARVIRESEHGAIEGYIDIEIMRYDVLADDLDEFDERQVICFIEDNGNCPESYPLLFSSSDAVNMIGVVYDNDVDGVPALFDHNDNDPNIPGLSGYGKGYPDEIGGIYGDELSIDSVVGVIDDGSAVRALIASTQGVYPGDIESIELKSDFFGEESPSQIVLGCEPPFIDNFGIYGDVRCATYPVEGGIELEVYRQSEMGVSLLMLMAPQTLDALDSHVDFSYQINYRVPTDADGLPLMCGTEACPSLPASSGLITVAVGADIPLHGQVSVQVQGQDPTDLLGLREIDVDREFRISATALPGALEYELSVYCPSSSQSTDVEAQGFYQPEENLQFYAPAGNEFGLPIPPEFNVHIPWLSGRECDISLRTPVKTEAGDLAGISLYVQGGVKLKGSHEGNSFIDNESALKVGDNVCISDGIRLTTDNCALDNSLFSVLSLTEPSSVREQVTLGLGKDIIYAQVNGYSRELLQTTLEADTLVSFDGIASGMQPACGEASSATQNSSSCATLTDELLPTFIVSADAQEMQLLLQDAIIEGPLNEQGNISLMESGFYSVVQPVIEPNTTSADSTVNNEDIVVLSAYNQLLNIMIDVYEDPTGKQGVFARFETVGNANFFDGNEAERQLTADVPSYLYMQTAEGLEIDLDARAIVDEYLKVTFHIHNPIQVNGDHDLNNDGLSDIEVTSDDALWTFRFTPSVDGVRNPDIPGEQEIPADASGYRTATFPVDQEFAEMFVLIGDTEFLVVAEFRPDGFSELRVVDQYPVSEEWLDPLFDGRPPEHFFPTHLSTASPFSRDQIEPASAPEFDTVMEPIDETLMFDFSSAALQKTSGFRADADRIAGILSGRFRLEEFFRPDFLRGSSANAHCFGPQLYYQNHPDGIDGEPMNDFTSDLPEPYPALPAGDLGIWTEYDQITGDACTAAQMNAQLDAARRRTFSGLVTLASIARRLNPEQQADILSGAEVSVVDKMNALSLPDVFFEQASISRQSDTEDWIYKVMLFENSADDTIGELTSIEMIFNPGDESELWDYSGVIRFRIEDNIASAECADSAVEHLSSLAFEREDQEHLKTEYRSGTYCGHGGVNGFDDNGRVDPIYSSAVASDGWAGNFSIFTANVNPSSGAGTYAYSWQAGANDSHSRVLNVGLNDFEPMDGEAWYGFGQSLDNGAETAGEINGFICNWAGPGNDHNLIEKAQRQSLVYDSATDLFIVPEGGSNITYAPTVACTYNTDEGGSFLYDRNLDGTLVDESSDSVDVGAGEQLLFDLAPPDSSTYFELDIEEVIQLRGFVKPESPVLAR
ncbi:MAG: hypothetical protein AB8B64_08290 [Granulosicoccus sp.]